MGVLDARHPLQLGGWPSVAVWLAGHVGGRGGALMRLLAALCIWIGASAAIYLLMG